MLLILTIILEHKCPENYTDSMYVLFLLLIPIAVLEGKCLEKVYCFYACALHIDCVYLEHEVLEDFTVSMHVLFKLFRQIVILGHKCLEYFTVSMYFL